MATPSPPDVTQLLLSWRNGEKKALGDLVPIVSRELRRLAHHYMLRERPGHVLQTTALVHEAYLRLIDAQHLDWQNRAHFFAISARLMRQVLVEFARSEQAQKRGAGVTPLSLDEAAVVGKSPDVDLLALDEALDRLAGLDERKAQIVEMRFFGGLSVEETAEVLKLAPITIMREWEKARAWLYQEIKSEK